MLLSIVPLLFVAALVNCGEIEDNELAEKPYMKYLKGYIEERDGRIGNISGQFESICPGKGSQFSKVLEEVKKCGDDIDEYSETACSITKNHFLNCAKPMINLLQQCLPEESREIPSFVFKSLVAGADYLCRTDGEHIFELANSCAYKSSARTARCERKIRTKIQQYKRSPPNKADFCDLLQSLKPCAQSHLLHACGNEITRQSFLGMYDALISPCNQANLIEPSTLDVNSRTY